MSKNNQSDKPLSFEAQAAQAIKDEAEKIANATQAPGQTKNETRLISQGIAKGIEAYKKQEKAKNRERSKNEKKKKNTTIADSTTKANELPKSSSGGLARLIKNVGNFLGLLALVHFGIVFIPKQTLEESIQWFPVIGITMGIFYLMASFMFGKISYRLRIKKPVDND